MNDYEHGNGGGAGDGLGRGETGAAGGADAVAAQDVAARLIGYRRHRHSLFDWMHPLRRARVPFADRVQGSDGPHAAALADAFLDDSGVPAPSWQTFSAPGVELIQMPMRICVAAFRLRALFEHTDEIRSWIDRPRRAQLNDWVGPQGTRLLLSRPRDLGGGNAASPAHAVPLGPAAADALAWRGLRLFARECGWPAAGPLAIAQFALPDEMPEEMREEARGSAAGATPAAAFAVDEWNPSLSIVSQLPDLFPEWP
jgi:hypothetical protein